MTSSSNSVLRPAGLNPAGRGPRGQTSAGQTAVSRGPRGYGLHWLRLAVWAVLALLVLLPLGVIVFRGAQPSNADVLTDPDVLAAAWNSVSSAAGSAALATAFGALLAVVLDRTDLPGRTVLRWIFLLPFLIPPFIGAMSWMALLSPAGTVNQALMALTGSARPVLDIYGGGGVVFLLAVHSYPLAYLVISAALRRVPGSLEEAARISGAGGLRTFCQVTLPLVRPAVVAAFVLTLVANLSDFGIPALIGLPERYTTLTTLVYRYLASGTVTNPLPAVAAIGVVLLVLGLAAVLLQRRLPGGSELGGAGAAALPLQLGSARWAVTALLWCTAAVVCVLPLLALTEQALLPAPGVPLTWENLTLANIARAVTSGGALTGIANSVMLALGAAVACGVLGLGVGALLTRTKHRSNAALDVTAMLPQALPGLVLAVAWLLIAPALGIFNTPWVILGAYVMAFLALVVQSVRAPLESVPVSLDEAARISGAGPLRALGDVALRLSVPAAVSGAVVVALTAVRELTISILLVAPGSQTLGVVIFNLQQAGDYNSASALALLVTIVGVAGLSATAALGARRTARTRFRKGK